MLKKILLGFGALVLLAVLVVGWTVVRPIYELAREISPSTAPEDYAKQDDSRVQLPTPRELETRPFDQPSRTIGRQLQGSLRGALLQQPGRPGGSHAGDTRLTGNAIIAGCETLGTTGASR
jgi:hypothetical protein